jgi:cell division protein FtsB
MREVTLDTDDTGRGDGNGRGVKRVTLVVALTLSVLYVVHLSGLVLKNRRAVEAEQHLSAQLDRERGAVEAIETETDRAYTDAYAEEFARNELKWVQPGDRAIVPVPVDPTATPSPPATPPEAEPGLLRRLRSFLRGS